VMMMMPASSPFRDGAPQKESSAALPEDVAEVPLIAVIDDDQSLRTAISRLLRVWGFRVDSYASAEAFLEQPTGVHCLVLDLHLGGMSGLELQARLADDARQVPIIFITAMEDSMIRRRALAAGAAAYLQKPFDDRRLLEVLYQVLDYRSE
jgi:FixJ family two-component response regulator